MSGFHTYLWTSRANFPTGFFLIGYAVYIRPAISQSVQQAIPVQLLIIISVRKWPVGTYKNPTSANSFGPRYEHSKWWKLVENPINFNLYGIVRTNVSSPFVRCRNLASPLSLLRIIATKKKATTTAVSNKQSKFGILKRAVRIFHACFILWPGDERLLLFESVRCFREGSGIDRLA